MSGVAGRPSGFLTLPRGALPRGPVACIGSTCAANNLVGKYWEMTLTHENPCHIETEMMLIKPSQIL
jgi:hypothetical protein